MVNLGIGHRMKGRKTPKRLQVSSVGGGWRHPTVRNQREEKVSGGKKVIIQFGTLRV